MSAPDKCPAEPLMTDMPMCFWDEHSDRVLGQMLEDAEKSWVVGFGEVQRAINPHWIRDFRERFRHLAAIDAYARKYRPQKPVAEWPWEGIPLTPKNLEAAFLRAGDDRWRA